MVLVAFFIIYHVDHKVSFVIHATWNLGGQYGFLLVNYALFFHLTGCYRICFNMETREKEV